MKHRSVAIASLILLAAAGVPDHLPPGATSGSQTAWAHFLEAGLPRAAALSRNGILGWSRAADLATARAAAAALCDSAGGTDCAPFAENLDVVAAGHPSAAAPPPPALISTWNYEFVSDQRYVWRGPRTATGVYVWCHGKSGTNDSRGLLPPAHVRWFNAAGYDIVRFDRAPLPDEVRRAGGWLHEGLKVLRDLGYARVVVGGQSRGAWNALQVLDTPGLADVVIATAPAAQGTAAGGNLFSQDDELRRLLDAVSPSRTRLAVVQFAGDLFMADPDVRVDAFEHLRDRLGALLLIDRPPGFTGHGAASGAAFADAYAGCLLRFASDTPPPSAC